MIIFRGSLEEPFSEASSQGLPASELRRHPSGVSTTPPALDSAWLPITLTPAPLLRKRAVNHGGLHEVFGDQLAAKDPTSTPSRANAKKSRRTIVKLNTEPARPSRVTNGNRGLRRHAARRPSEELDRQ